MTWHEFTKQMEKLSAEWKSGFGQSKIQRLFEQVRNFEVLAFGKAIDFTLDSCKYAPTVSEIVNKTREHSQNRKTANYCELCNGSATILVVALKNGKEGNMYGRRCDCVGGPKRLADRIRNHPVSPDKDLADRIEKQQLYVEGVDYRVVG